MNGQQREVKKEEKKTECAEFFFFPADFWREPKNVL